MNASAPQPKTQPDRLRTLAVADMLGVSVQTVKNLARTDRLPTAALTHGGARLFDRSTVEAFALDYRKADRLPVSGEATLRAKVAALDSYISVLEARVTALESLLGGGDLASARANMSDLLGGQR